ncbi:CPBP family glutamic-type intramembrane protease [Qipengyuania sp. G39]|uniref:CPBP family glutamic-type intramembrane protease n=1 Tax=Qipengyuania profundimaris TaxID=3067652 RepID=A0ABT9HT36_9SPHN|nr:CPBP family glutamic-type intramembrane protease [Qipengyuania sp. G39]MDP4576304.1 CPBP family glutamic-type intramembrane protease [Qipengyuania sp. G39]
MTTSASGAIAPAGSIMGEWRQFGRFLKRPTLPPRAPMPRMASLLATLRLLLLDFAIMLALLAIAGIVMAAGTELPETAIAGMEMTGGLVFAAVVVAPLTEEIAFRGWLSGRPGHVLAIVLAIPAALVAVTVTSAFAGGGGLGEIWLGALIGVSVAVVVALITIYALRKRDAMGWFQRLFPLFFWLSTLAFSLIHIFNFPADQMVMALPLVLPQFATGAILGYIRVNYGLWASILLHTLHNGTFIGLVLLAGQAAG